MKPTVLLLLPLLLLGSCAGYRLGGPQPAALAKVRTLAIPMFANDTQHPRAEVIATSALSSAVTQDGTYRIARTAQADAVLQGRIKSITYTAIRSRRLDTLRPEELASYVTLEWTLKETTLPGTTLAAGAAVGTSSFFVDRDLQTARNNALPDALERASQAIVSQLANGF
jgi:hypothetical protein